MTGLRQRMIEDMQVRNLAPDTQHTYLHQVSLYVRHFGKSPELLGPADIRAYQIYLVRDRRLAAGSVVVALRFLYKITLKRAWSFDEALPTCRTPRHLLSALFVLICPKPSRPCANANSRSLRTLGRCSSRTTRPLMTASTKSSQRRKARKLLPHLRCQPEHLVPAYGVVEKQQRNLTA
jgi:hypothetical protein